MELKYEVTEEDYIQFNLYHAKNSKAYKSQYNMMKYAIAILSTIVVFFVGPTIFNQPKIYWGIIAILFGIVWIVRFPKTYDRIIGKSVLKLLKDGDNSSMICENMMIINENEIRVINKNTTEITSRQGIKDVKIYDDMILIYLSGISAHIIPTRYLSVEDKEKFLREINRIKR